MGSEEFISLLHGFLGTIVLMSFSGVLLGLFSLNKNRYNILKYSIIIMTIAVILIDIFGMMIYAVYRETNADSAKSKILASDKPWVHEILMEFKEFSGIYVAIILILASFLVIEFKDELFKNKQIRNTLVLMMTLAMLLTLITFGLGAYITKVQSI
ncbi:MAG: hypothetical protein AABW41_00545 [Nanoarchaeota archaeon]